ncbi:MAG: hypothetical protein WDM90_22225 [Ferruginibacter sp.]
MVGYVGNSRDSVDIVVMVKDVFSLGGNAKIDKTTRGRLQISDDNFAGTGTNVFVGGFYDEERTPDKAYSAGITKRNIGWFFY